MTVQVLIVDSRDATRVIEVGRDELFGSQPEALAALPGRLNQLFRTVEKDAQRKLSQLLAELIALAPPTPTSVSEPAVRLLASAKGIQLMVEDPTIPTLVPDDYVVPISLPLLDDGLVLLAPAGEGTSPVP